MAPAVIILDLKMADIDGFAVLEQLQADATTRAIPVIIATSLSVTATLRARLPAGIRILAKNGMSREAFTSALNEATGSEGPR